MTEPSRRNSLDSLQFNEIPLDTPIPESPTPTTTPNTFQKVKDFMETHQSSFFIMTACLTLTAASITLCSLGLIPLVAAVTAVAITATATIGGIMKMQRENHDARPYQ